MKSLEIDAIVQGHHNNPHNILGSHSEGNKNYTRVYMPDAQEIVFIDPEGNKYTLSHLREGFFEGETPYTNDYTLEIKKEDHVWQTKDPYSFEPWISELDTYLFKQGTHYSIYDKMGSSSVTINGVEGVLFAVWAPNAKRVSVIGNFNNWDGRIHPMRDIYFSGIWELFIPGLQNYDMYKYEIKAANDDILIKTDPFGKFSEMRPGKASFVYDIRGYEWGDEEYMRNPRKIDGPMTIYEVHLGSWKRGENNRFLSYTELAHDLVPYVKEMGYTHIELMPLQEHPLDLSWGYQVTGYYSVTSRFGNPHEFMYFVDYCHRHGIGVILDWVPAHFPKDDNGLAYFDGTALYEHENPLQGEQSQWGTKIFNFGRNEVKNFLIAGAIFWIETYHLDGLRVDAVSSMLYLDYGKEGGDWIPNKYGGRENEEAIEFLKHLNSVLTGRYPHIHLVAEESTSWPKVSHPAEYGGLGFNLKWNMGWMNDFLTYISKDPIHRRYHHNNITFGMTYVYSENFILVLSHDEVVHGKKSLVDKMPGDLWQKFANLRLSFGFMYGHPGKKLVFMGGEFGQFSEWSEARSLDWHLLEYPHHKSLQNFVKDLNRVYLENEAFWYGDFYHNGFRWISVDDASRSVVAFCRFGRRENDIIMMICNFTPIVHEDFKMGVPLPGVYSEILNSDQNEYGGSGVINMGELFSEQSESYGYENSIRLRVPPLGVSVLKFLR